VGEIAERLNVTAPTVRGRIRSLEGAGLLKISGLIDPFQQSQLTTAIIGLSVQSHGKLDEVLERLSKLEGVVWAGVVTGRYDVILQVVASGGMQELYRLTTDVIPKVGTVVRSETFVIMKSKNQWLRLPESVEVSES
jgi:Lrp/AsnC family transcriptional regulator for asnA, asnC and gidA